MLLCFVLNSKARGHVTTYFPSVLIFPRHLITKIITTFLHKTALLTCYKLWPYRQENNFITWILDYMTHPWLNTKAWRCLMDHAVFAFCVQKCLLCYFLKYFGLFYHHYNAFKELGLVTRCGLNIAIRSPYLLGVLC